MNKLETVSIIGGFGAMGHFMEQRMFPDSTVLIHDPVAQTTDKGVTQEEYERFQRTHFVNFDEAMAADATVLAVPAQALETVVMNVADAIRTDGTSPLVVDICSVKQHPTALFSKHLADHTETLLCHPLFGPRSAKDRLDGHKVIVLSLIHI